MPDYDEFVNKARSTAAGEVDRSAVDYAWAATALRRGHSADDVISELERVSLKAAGLSGRARNCYLRRTVRAARRVRDWSPGVRTTQAIQVIFASPGLNQHDY